MSMAPRALLILTCFRHVADVPVPAKENARGSEKRRRRWTGEIKRKILATARRPRIWSVSEEEPCDVDVKKKILATARRPRIWSVSEEEPCDVDVKKQRAQAPEPKVPEQQAPPRREGAQVLQSDRSPSNDGAPPDAVAVDDRRKRKGLRVHFDLPPQEISAAPPVEPRFPTGVLGEPPTSFAHSGADMTAAFLMSAIAEKSRGTDSATQVDRDLVACWTERKAACSRRLSYLRDYCPFQREEEEAEDDESDELLETTTTTTRPEAEPGHAEVWPVKTGLLFDCPDSEAEFAKAIRSRYLLKVKDDFLFRHAYERSRDRAAEPDGRRRR